MSELLERQTKIQKGPPAPPGVTLDLSEPGDRGWYIVLWINKRRISIRLTHTQMFAVLELVVAHSLGRTHTRLEQCSGGSRQYAHQIVLRIRKTIDAQAPGWGKRLVRSVRPFRGFRLREVNTIRRRKRFSKNLELFGSVVSEIIELIPEESDEMTDEADEEID